MEVTDLLLRGFKLDEKQKRVLEEMRKRQLPPKEAEKMMREGKL